MCLGILKQKIEIYINDNVVIRLYRIFLLYIFRRHHIKCNFI